MPKPKLEEEIEYDPNIDMNRLDYEWWRQPRMHDKYARAHAEAIHATDTAKARLELVRCELDNKMRTNPAAYDLGKATDKAIEAAIVVEKQYQAAQKAYLECKRQADLFKAGISSLEHRKRALENLVELHGRDYFSTPVARGKAGESMSDAKKKAARRRMQDKDEEDDDES